jgi:hypothetical protein
MGRVINALPVGISPFERRFEREQVWSEDPSLAGEGFFVTVSLCPRQHFKTGANKVIISTPH